MTNATPTQRPSGPAARNRLNLIEQLTAEAVASDYSGAVPEPSPSSQRQRRLVAVIVLGVTGFVLALGVSARVLNAPAVDDQRAALQERIRQQDELQDELLASTAELRTQVQQARADELESIQGGTLLAEQIARYELVTGYRAVEGPGVVVTLTDSADTDDDATSDVQRVLDSDIQRAVNGLWRAGAEAIAINGQRLSARSAIRSAADAILVNYRPLRPPYQIEAIGDPDTLERRFAATPDAAELVAVSQQFGIGFDTESVAQVQLPAATGALPEDAEIIQPEQGVSQ